MARENTEKARYLQAGIVCFVVWVLLASYMFNELKEIDGVIYIINSAKEGNYKPFLLVTLSVILLAYAIRNFVFYFKAGMEK